MRAIGRRKAVTGIDVRQLLHRAGTNQPGGVGGAVQRLVVDDDRHPVA